MLKTNLEIDTPFSRVTNKGKRIKDWYSLEFAEILANEISKGSKSFNNKLFFDSYKKQYKSLELKERLKLIASLLYESLEGPYSKKLKALYTLLGPAWPYEEGMMNYGFYLYPISQFVEEYAYQNIEQSLAFIYDLTQRFTGEFAIRPILSNEPKLALKTLKEWSRDKSFHVRRLSSEGVRIRLPWGQSVEWIKTNPEKVIPIFNKLRNDSSLYVRRSVANGMGDLIKCNPDFAISIFEKWLEKKNTLDNLWVIKHAIRHPVKKGDSHFIKLKKEIYQRSLNLS